MVFTPLLQHQKKALEYLEGRNKAALFMCYGLGKSLIALAHAERLGAKRVLITSDKVNVVSTWPDQISQHTDYNYVVRQSNNLHKSCVGDSNHVWCYIINYDLLGSCWEEYSKFPFDLWIGDESSEFKDQRTAKHKHLYHVVKNIPNKIILNGSPMTERLEDLYGQIKVLDNGVRLGSSMTKFRQRYMQPHPLGYGWVAKRSAYTNVQEALKDASYWQTTSTGIKMPNKCFHTIHVDQTPEQNRIDRELIEQFAAHLNNQTIEVKQAATVFIKRLQLAGGIFKPTDDSLPSAVDTLKIDVVKDVIRRNPDNKIVVWHEYIAETDLLLEKLCPFVHDLGIQGFVLTDSSDVRPLTYFKESKSGVLLIRNSFCKGLNQLADGDIAIFYSNPLSYRDRSQAIGRTCRMSSKTLVTHIVDIVTKKGADEIVYNQLSGKKDMSLTLSRLREMVQ